ncbi:MAG: Dabb family protein [Verrucomicrobiales bacterium]
MLFKLKPEVDEAKLEEMIQATRTQLAAISVVLDVRAGRNVDPSSDWPFFLSVEVESIETLAIYRDDPLHMVYVDQVIKPYTTERQALDYVT